jgi:sigma-B regulation protein RsbU (phosphoserine phosphatase)
MAQDLLHYIENLKKTTAERERMTKELEIGHQIQQNFLPTTFPQLSEVQIFGQSIPAQEVGGDFFDVFMLDPQHVGLVIADVSGKGVPAALFMALSRSVLRITAQGGLGPHETLENPWDQRRSSLPERLQDIR